MKMTHLQLSELVLILSCSTKVLIVQFFKILTTEHDYIVSINSVQIALQQVIIKLEVSHIDKDIKLFQSDTFNLNFIISLHDTTLS